jgi:hypothetical protein
MHMSLKSDMPKEKLVFSVLEPAASVVFEQQKLLLQAFGTFKRNTTHGEVDIENHTITISHITSISYDGKLQ